MFNQLRPIVPVILVLVVVSGKVSGQGKEQGRTLVVNGQAGQAAIIEMYSRTYVDLEALARIANGVVEFQGNRIAVTIPAGGANTAGAMPDQPGDSGFSKEFMKAGIEEIARMREWASPLAYAIRNGYPITEQWVAGYRDQATHGLSMASIAATTEADRRALQLLTNEFEGVKEWSNKLVEARNSLDTAKYAMSPGALQNDPLSQKLITCGRFLAAMLASGQFQDDPSCH